MKRIFNIKKPSSAVMEKASARIDSLVKPIGSLGTLESMAVKLAGIYGGTTPPPLNKAIAVFAADNGVWEEDITPVPQAVTAVQAMNIARGVTGVGVIAACVNADVFVYDLGIRGFHGAKRVENRRVGNGTRSIMRGPAMEITQAVQAIAHGLDAAEALVDKGYRLLGCGEMGICNTTTSSAVLCALTGVGVDEAVGRGSGLTDAQLEKKRDVVRRALEINQPDGDNTLAVLASLGGFDIAAMTGFFLGCAYRQTAVVIDGFISAVAALVASRLNPLVKEYMFGSHHSAEPGFGIAMNALGLSAPLRLDMRLGEGSGCPFGMQVIEAAAAVLANMATFEEAGIDPTKLVDNRRI